MGISLYKNIISYVFILIFLLDSIFMTTTLLNKMFSSIKNAQLAKKTVIFQKKSNLSFSFLNLLWDEGFILGFKISLFSKFHYEIYLKLHYNTQFLMFSKIQNFNKYKNIKKISSKQIWKLNLVTEILILSTSQGLLTHLKCKKYNLGGKPFILLK